MAPSGPPAGKAKAEAKADAKAKAKGKAKVKKDENPEDKIPRVEQPDRNAWKKLSRR